MAASVHVIVKGKQIYISAQGYGQLHFWRGRMKNLFEFLLFSDVVRN